MSDTIGFIGCGKMASALIQAMIQSRAARPDQILCADINTETLNRTADQLGVRTAVDNQEVIQNCDYIFLAFKPQGFPQSVEPLTALIRPEQVVISIMAGIRIDSIAAVLPAHIIRLMPNTPCLAGAMAAGLAVAPGVPQPAIDTVLRLLAGAGITCVVEEDQLDAVTGLSGSGPAFVAYLIDSFIQAGIKQGLAPDIARQLTLQTFSGTAQLLAQHKITPQDLIQMVSSPNGTTVAGRSVLEASQAAAIIEETVNTAARRSRELSGI